MTIELANNTWLTLVSDANTPANLTQYAGIRLLLAPADVARFPPPGVPDVLTVLGVNVPGYWRPAANGGYEWVMSAAVSPIAAALNRVPGADGWAAPSARATYSSMGSTLLQHFSLTETESGLTQLYQAAVTNNRTAHP